MLRHQQVLELIVLPVLSVDMVMVIGLWQPNLQFVSPARLVIVVQTAIKLQTSAPLENSQLQQEAQVVPTAAPVNIPFSVLVNASRVPQATFAHHHLKYPENANLDNMQLQGKPVVLRVIMDTTVQLASA